MVNSPKLEDFKASMGVQAFSSFLKTCQIEIFDTIFSRELAKFLFEFYEKPALLISCSMQPEKHSSLYKRYVPWIKINGDGYVKWNKGNTILATIPAKNFVELFERLRLLSFGANAYNIRPDTNFSFEFYGNLQFNFQNLDELKQQVSIINSTTIL